MISKNVRKIAKLLMFYIQQDNGCINRQEGNGKYPEEWIIAIAEPAKKFFTHNDQLLDEKIIEEIAIGAEDGAMRKKYAVLHGFKQLDEVLNKYYDHVCNTK
jgi:hypothetical protein